MEPEPQGDELIEPITDEDEDNWSNHRWLLAAKGKTHEALRNCSSLGYAKPLLEGE